MIEKVIQGKSQEGPPDTVHLQYESPTAIFGPHIDDKEGLVAPFYGTLNIHDKILHNCMLDSDASHNLMPKVVMQKLGLEITKTYHDLYSFDSKKVKCEGLIKNMVFTLAQLHVKRIMMDVVVVDVLENYRMLCWQPIQFFPFSCKLPTLMSCEHQVFRRIFQIHETFIS
jgi:hypothetical protein